jgi:hypothetical protein
MSDHHAANFTTLRFPKKKVSAPSPHFGFVFSAIADEPAASGHTVCQHSDGPTVRSAPRDIGTYGLESAHASCLSATRTARDAYVDQSPLRLRGVAELTDFLR